MDVARLSEDNLLIIRRRMARTLIAKTDAFGGDKPVRPELLASAASRQLTALGGVLKYNTVHAVAATLFYGIATNHAFENGNKRTAIIALLVLLDRNRLVLTDTTENELYDLATQVVEHSFPLRTRKETRDPDAEVRAVASWIRGRARKITLPDRRLKYRQLKSLLESFDCRFDDPYRNFVKIHRGGYSVSTGYPKHNFELAVKEVKRIREALHLDQAHGVDGLAFYDIEAKVDHFVGTYRDLLRRLADA